MKSTSNVSLRAAEAWGAALLVCLALGGCSTVAPEPAPKPSMDDVPEIVEEAPPVEEAAPIAIPATCEELLPIATVATYSPYIELFAEGDAASGGVFAALGPKTVAALQDGEQQTYCGWAIPRSDGLGWLGAASLNENEKSELLASLRDSVYEEVDPGNAESAFYWGMESGHVQHDEILIGEDFFVAIARTVEGDFARDVFANIEKQRQD